MAKKGFLGLFSKTKPAKQWPALAVKVSPELKAAFIEACGDKKPHAVLKKFVENYAKRQRKKTGNKAGIAGQEDIND